MNILKTDMGPDKDPTSQERSDPDSTSQDRSDPDSTMLIKRKILFTKSTAPGTVCMSTLFFYEGYWSLTFLKDQISILVAGLDSQAWSDPDPLFNKKIRSCVDGLGDNSVWKGGGGYTCRSACSRRPWGWSGQTQRGHPAPGWWSGSSAIEYKLPYLLSLAH